MVYTTLSTKVYFLLQQIKNHDTCIAYASIGLSYFDMICLDIVLLSTVRLFRVTFEGMRSVWKSTISFHEEPMFVLRTVQKRCGLHSFALRRMHACIRTDEAFYKDFPDNCIGFDLDDVSLGNCFDHCFKSSLILLHCMLILVLSINFMFKMSFDVFVHGFIAFCIA